MDETNCCNTENKRRRRGRPALPGRSIIIPIRFREGIHDAILERLAKVPKGGRSAYIRRVLEGAPVEALDQALVEDEETTAALDNMWFDDLDFDDDQ
jgi:hypothetical protein